MTALTKQRASTSKPTVSTKANHGNALATTGLTVGGVCHQCRCGQVMIERFNSGNNVGQSYLGCTRFPLCRFFQWIH